MTILADSNIWRDHFRKTDSVLVMLLQHDFLAIHDVVIGELSVGSIAKCEQTLSDLQKLPQVPEATFSEVLHLIQQRSLWGRGIQWNDCQLLASVVIAGQTLLYTRDKSLAKAAQELGHLYQPSGKTPNL